MRISVWYNNLVRYEWLLFCVIAILNLIPAIQQPFFPSTDGPTHLYNANLILQLVSGHSEFLSGYYAFTDWIVPNWGGHFILASLLSVFSPMAASRIFVGLCLFFLPLSFRYLSLQINKDARFASYLIFPLCYSFMLCMGFYNFIFGLIMLFTTLGILIRYRSSPFRWPSFILLFFMVLFCYLSHLFAFLCLGMIVYCLYSLDILQTLIAKKSIRELLKSITRIITVFALPLFLTLVYYTKTGTPGGKTFLPKDELVDWITMGRSMIWYFVTEESPYTGLIVLTILCLFPIAVFLYVRTLWKSLRGSNSALSSFIMQLSFREVSLLMLILMVVLYFLLPDSDASAGFVSVRLNLMIFVFLILWLSAFHFPKWIALSAVAILFYAQYHLLTLHSSYFKKLNPVMLEILAIEQDIKEHTVILPLNYSDEWPEHHSSNYLGIRKPVVIMENHESNNAYFPLKWNCDGKMQDLAHSNFSRFDEILQRTAPEILGRMDYVFVLNKKAFPDSLKQVLLQSFHLKKETPGCLLFEAGKR